MSFVQVKMIWADHVAHMGNKCTISWRVNLKEGDHFEGLGIDERILTCISKTQDVNVRHGFIWLMTGADIVVYCLQVDELPFSSKCREFFHLKNNYQLLKRAYAARS
jgi:hypothetical protein